MKRKDYHNPGYAREYYRRNAARRRRQRLESHTRLGLPHKYIIQAQSERRVRGRALRASQPQEHLTDGASNF